MGAPDERVAIVEESFLGLSELLDVGRERRDGWLALTTPDGGEMRNGVLHAVLADADADATIEATVARYGDLGTPFRWHVGPSGRPRDLGERLLAHGFERVDTLAGMCVATSRAIAADPSISVTELATDDDAERFLDVLRVVHGAPDHVMARMRRELLARPGERRQRHYLARRGGVPVGATSYAIMPRCGFLQGAAVLEPHRGRGVYRAMIRVRLADLRARGLELATVTARRSTSAPICARLGFEEVCAIEVYRHG